MAAISATLEVLLYAFKAVFICLVQVTTVTTRAIIRVGVTPTRRGPPLGEIYTA